MKFNVLTIFPDMFSAFQSQGVIGQAVKKGLIELSLTNPRQFTEDFHQSVDARPYGGGDGMVMLAEPLRKAFENLKHRNELGHVIYMSPQGKKLTANRVESLSESKGSITLLCGRYGGVDERLLQEYVDEEISVGDFVVSGGELPAMLLMDAIGRHIPGVLGHEDSAKKESFHSGLLESPTFTRPREVFGLSVPEELLNGDHKAIEVLRYKLALVRTALRRPDLIQENQQSELNEFVQEMKTWEESRLRACGLKMSELEQLNV